MQISRTYIYMDMEMKFIFLFRSNQALFPSKFQTFELFHAPILPFFLLGFYRIRSSSFLFGCKSAGTIARKEASAGINRKLSPMPSILPVNFREEHASTRFISSAREQIWLNDDLFPRGSCPGKLVTLEPRQVSINFEPVFCEPTSSARDRIKYRIREIILSMNVEGFTPFMQNFTLWKKKYIESKSINFWFGGEEEEPPFRVSCILKCLNSLE